MRYLLSVLASFAALVTIALAQTDVRKERIQFGGGQTSKTIRSSIRGYATIDYLVRAGAGQTLSVTLKGSNGANYFNVLSPGSGDAAMFIGELSDNKMEKRILPIDGDYTIRVNLVRAAARRNETSTFTLSLSIGGKALPSSVGASDRKLPGTPFHASMDIDASLSLNPNLTQCKAYVIRRSFDGTATVELRAGTVKRRVLFVKGKPTASDSAEAFTFERKEELTVVKFGDDPSERYFIPDLLIFGG